MFIGHFGVGFAAKKVVKKTSLGTLFLASQFVDLLWPILLILGIEKVEINPVNTGLTPLNFVYYPFSHSLLAAIVWAFIFGLIYYLIKKDLGSAIWCGLLVPSHWILDLIVHRPDLPLWPGHGSPMFGLGLWSSIYGTIIIEVGIFLVGVYLYSKTTEPKNKTGSISLWILVIFLLLVYFMNIFGPPPNSIDAIGYVGLSQFILIAWGYWIDKNRQVREKS
ncbi:hypothetical protein LJE86_15225 [bacterium BMS3Abin03]|nr:hypothetical protein [bacterium BMS3Abin03]MCG6960995.1 hypothetical protein [bacterium BMS3Abin03]